MTRRRGRPARGSAVFDDKLQAKFLTEVAGGARLGEAADAVGVHRNLPRYHAQTNAGFAQALEDAVAKGKAARDDKVPHGEYRYKNLGCRCRKVCVPAGTAARARLRHATVDTEGEAEAPTVVRPLAPPAEPESPTSFLLPGRSSVPGSAAA